MKMGTLLWIVRFLLLMVWNMLLIDGAAMMQTQPPADRDTQADHAEEDQVWKREKVSLPAYENFTSFSSWVTQISEQVEGQPVAVRVLQVNGELELTLPPNTNPNLVRLSLHQTNLTHFTNHTQVLSTLEELILSGNPDFDPSSLLLLGKLPSLVTLKMAGTPLAMLSNRKLKQVLKEMPALQYLDISFSNLHHLAANTFEQNTKLKKLNVAGNELVNLSLDGGLIQQLVHLNLSGCSLEQLQLVNNPQEANQSQLHVVDLSHNNLTTLPPAFINVIANSLVHLNISDNLWNNSCTLCSLYHLWRYINMTYHPDKIHGARDLDCFRPEEALKTCGWEECPPTCTCDPKSKTVNCSSSDMKSVPYLGPSDTEILILKNNSLLNMSGIESPVWCKLKTVIADHNIISSIIPPSTLGRCTCFDHDDINGEEENCLPQSLQKLSLSHNEIKNLSGSDCQLLYSLRELDLSGNKVEHLGSHVCSRLERLKALFLNNNSISDLEERDVAPYSNLGELNLSFNELVTLHYHTIELMPKLRILNVSHNKLRELSKETSTADTPFTFTVPMPLEELDLSNNNLELIHSVFSLKHIPNLKKLTIFNNPWEYSCEIKKFLAWMLKDFKNIVVGKDVETLECEEAPKKTPKQTCLSTEHNNGFFEIIVGILIVFFLFALLIHVTYRKIPPNIFYVPGLPSVRNYSTDKRTYTVFIVNSGQDDEMVKTDLVDPFTNLGYSVLWNQNAYPLGDNREASIEKAVINSRRMLVVASNNLMTCSTAKQVIQRGLDEEHRVRGFKVIALVLDDLPRTLYPALYEIVARRTNVLRQNSNYIRAICDFLPAPRPSNHIITFTETDLYCFLWQQWELIRRRENQRAHLQEVFPSQNSDPHGSSAGSSTLQIENGVAMSSISDDILKAVRSRCHGRHAGPALDKSYTFSYHYTLEINTKDEEEVAWHEGFRRASSERHSTKF